ncbi:MAG: hypothetical protein ABSF91_06360, partial [Bacteroidota bacterium]
DGSANGGTPYAVKATGPWGTSNPNATYAITAQAAASITFTGTSKTVTGSTVAITFDANGKGTVPTYTGQFL